MPEKLGIVDTTIVERESVGTRFIGEWGSLIFHRGKLVPAYDKVFIAEVTDENIKHFLDGIENDRDLNQLNVGEEGFIFTIPFNYIKQLELKLSLIRKEEIMVKVTDYLKEDRMLLNLRASNKKEAIEELLTLLKGSQEIINVDIFLKDIMDEESLNTSGVSDFIAIPHARTDAVNSFIIAFGRSVNGIDFPSMDNKPSKLIFLMGTPKEHGLNKYLAILAHLIKILQSKTFRETLLASSTTKEIIEEFKRAEMKLFPINKD